MRFLRIAALLLGLVTAACGTAAVSAPSFSGEVAALEMPVAEETTNSSATSAETIDDDASDASSGAVIVGDAIDLVAVTDALTTALEAWIADNGAPGASLSVRLGSEDPIAVAVGVSNLATGEAARTDDFFRIGSVTKPMTSTVVLQLVSEGLVELDEPVSTYLGEGWLGTHSNAGTITVRQLLNHTNGLVEFAFDVGFYIEAAQRPDTPYAPEEILEFLSRQEPLFAPGEQYRYETGGYVTAGLIIEAVTGNPAAAEMRARLFDPSGASNIYLLPQEFPPKPVVHSYSRGELYDALILLPSVSDDLGLTIEGGEPVLDTLAGSQAVLQSAGWTGGGVEAQLSDVSAVLKAMFDGTLLDETAIAQMTQPTLDRSYGLGISSDDIDGTVVYSHGGGVPGFRSQAGYLPEFDSSYAFSVNLIPLPDGKGVDELQRAIVDIIGAALGSS